MIVKLKKNKNDNDHLILDILNYLEYNDIKHSFDKIGGSKIMELGIDGCMIYQDNNPYHEVDNFYVINLKEIKKTIEYETILKNHNVESVDFILIDESLLIKDTSTLQSINKSRHYAETLENEEQRFNEVFSRYAKKISTVVVNQHSNNKNIINIQDSLSIRHLFLTYDNSVGCPTYDCITEMSGYYMNPNMATMFNAKKVKAEMLFELFGIKENELKDKILKLKEKQLDICLIGLGGTMSNFVYFLNEIINYFKVEDLFKRLVIFENDYLEVSNLPRIPLDYLTPVVVRKHNLIAKIDIFKNVRNLFKKSYLNVKHFDYNFARLFDFVIGSPDIQTRVNMFENAQKNFICPLHFNNDLVIFENPQVIASDISAETYGSIELTYFFLNMFRMTIELIDIMLKDKLEINKKVFSYNSKESIDEFRKNTAKSENCYVLS